MTCSDSDLPSAHAELFKLTNFGLEIDEGRTVFDTEEPASGTTSAGTLNMMASSKYFSKNKVSGYGHPNADTKNVTVNFIWNLVALAKIEQKLAHSLNKSLTKILCQKDLQIDNTPTNPIHLLRGALSPDTFTLNPQTQAFEYSFGENLHSHFKHILNKTNPGLLDPSPTLLPLPPNDSHQFAHMTLDRPGLTLYIDKNYFGRLMGEIYYELKRGALDSVDG
jgi:hypothetical protein